MNALGEPLSGGSLSICDDGSLVLYQALSQTQNMRQENGPMFRRIALALLVTASSAAVAEPDEISPVPAQALLGHAYQAENTPSEVRFINVRSRPVRIAWVQFDGREREYAQLRQGDEIIQPTFVAHRWLIRDAGDGTPLMGFISTRSAAHSNGTPQIALIR